MLDRPAFALPPPGQRRPRSAGPRPRLCQWIDGEPNRREGCKCGAPVAPASCYCEAHRVRAVLSPGAVPVLPQTPATEPRR